MKYNPLLEHEPYLMPAAPAPAGTARTDRRRTDGPGLPFDQLVFVDRPASSRAA